MMNFQYIFLSITLHVHESTNKQVVKRQVRKDTFEIIKLFLYGFSKVIAW